MKRAQWWKRIIATLAVGSFLLGLTACGERPQVISYKQGTYQGKPDTHPYGTAPFNGDKTKWENEMRNRTQAQNEYNRIR